MSYEALHQTGIAAFTDEPGLSQKILIFFAGYTIYVNGCVVLSISWDVTYRDDLRGMGISFRIRVCGRPTSLK
jgi:hypothetical protein